MHGSSIIKGPRKRDDLRSVDIATPNVESRGPVKFGRNGPGVRLVLDSVVTASALSFDEDAYGTAINGQTFQQEALVSWKQYQYAAYYDSRGRTAVARRRLPKGRWQQIVFDDYGPITHTDIHNVIVLGICPGDGTIHLSYDQHCDDLRYRRSMEGIASDPENFAWSQDLFSGNTSELIPERPIGSVTYPQLFSSPQGRLQFCFRVGCSGDGDWEMYEYDSGRWCRIGMLFSRRGSFQGKTSRCAYPNPFRYDRNNRLHCTWTWREEGTDVNGNHDLCYAYSDDFGRTWRRNDGVAVASLRGQARAAGAIRVDTPGLVVCPIKYDWGSMNTTTQAVDGKGRVHVICWRNPDDAPAGSMDLNRFRYYHHWRDIDGRWQQRILPFQGRKPQVILDERGNMFIVFGQAAELDYRDSDPGSSLSIATAEEKDGWSSWKVLSDMSPHRHIGEPLLDVGRWEQDKVLSAYLQEMPGTAGDDAPLRVLDFHATLPAGRRTKDARDSQVRAPGL